MSGRRDPSPSPGDAAQSQETSTSPLVSAPSSENTALNTILAKLSGLDETISGFRRSMQRMDGRLDTVVGGLTTLRERVQEMEDWLPGNDPDTLSEAGDRHSLAAQPTATTVTQTTPTIAAEATNSSPVVSSTPQVTSSASQPPVRPPRATDRPPHLPHASKPPQVRAFRSLTIADKDELRRLAGLLGGSVRTYLDGDIDVEALAHAEADGLEDHHSQHSSASAAPSETGEHGGDHHARRTTHATHRSAIPTPTTLQTPPTSPVHIGTLTCKQEFLGSFDGKPFLLENFVSRVRNLRRSDRRPAWESAIIRALPMALKGDAAAWHEGLADEEAEELDTVDKWVAAMRSAFPVNSLQQRKAAQNRSWRSATETISEYYHQKLRLLRQAYGSDQSEERLVSEIKDALPATMRAMIRVPIKGATLLDLRTELIEAEPQWKEIYDSSSATTLATRNTASKPTPNSKLDAPAMARSATAPARPVAIPASPATHPSTGGFGLAATYDPSRVTPAANGKPRTYRRPTDDVVMELNRPCQRCQGDHFNFEHFHLAAPQVRTLEVLSGDDEYPEVEDESRDVVDHSDFM
ncbi:hypothetical protein A4X13_0g7787 [Tilletia indica]|uniref:Retrotransposon gag domain-containing protein n=1 Tax=Tilletia indica TaxID=43049 RepID=A0A177TIB3_9BASI|nr:hypothetical protein A4X13_0g7787 [Tilletia indica]